MRTSSRPSPASAFSTASSRVRPYGPEVGGDVHLRRVDRGRDRVAPRRPGRRGRRAAVRRGSRRARAGSGRGRSAAAPPTGRAGPGPARTARARAARPLRRRGTSPGRAPAGRGGTRRRRCRRSGRRAAVDTALWRSARRSCATLAAPGRLARRPPPPRERTRRSLATDVAQRRFRSRGAGAQRSVIGTYARSVGPTYSWRGRPIRFSGSLIISRQCEIHPGSRPSANSTVNIFVGKPIAR